MWSANAPPTLDLFCGVGGLSLGLLDAGFRLIGAADLDPLAITAHRLNFPSVPPLVCDLFHVDAAKALREAFGLGSCPLDLLAGGPPCQGFSAGGRHQKQDPRNKGVLAFARLVAELKPRYFLMENVRGFLFKNHIPLRRRFVRTVKDAGYEVLPFTILNAADFGVPQRRHRAFVLGHLASEPTPEYPRHVTGLGPTVRDAIADLAAIDARPGNLEGDSYRGPLDQASKYSARLRGSLEGVEGWGVSGCLGTAHSDLVVERFRATPPGGQERISRFYRLSWDGISLTLRAGTGPDHGSHTAPRPIHPDGQRCINVREAARLHSFPDWFVFHCTRWHALRQIGNSVPPLLAHAIGTAIHDAINRREEGVGHVESSARGRIDA